MKVKDRNGNGKREKKLMEVKKWEIRELDCE